jgi:hypothetical protein
MALNKEELIVNIEKALDKLSESPPSDNAKQEFAKLIADAIHTYVRTGKVNVPGEGNKPVR